MTVPRDDDTDEYGTAARKWRIILVVLAAVGGPGCLVLAVLVAGTVFWLLAGQPPLDALGE